MKKDEEFGCWAIIHVGVQLVLFGKPVTKDIVLESHITHEGRLLCKESLEVLVNRAKEKHDAKNIEGKYLKVRPNNHVCPKCLRLYKEKSSAYRAWVAGTELKEAQQPEPLKF